MPDKFQNFTKNSISPFKDCFKTLRNQIFNFGLYSFTSAPCFLGWEARLHKSPDGEQPSRLNVGNAFITKQPAAIYERPTLVTLGEGGVESKFSTARFSKLCCIFVDGHVQDVHNSTNHCRTPNLDCKIPYVGYGLNTLSE